MTYITHYFFPFLYRCIHWKSRLLICFHIVYTFQLCISAPQACRPGDSCRRGDRPSEDPSRGNCAPVLFVHWNTVQAHLTGVVAGLLLRVTATDQQLHLALKESPCTAPIRALSSPSAATKSFSTNLPGLCWADIHATVPHAQHFQLSIIQTSRRYSTRSFTTICTTCAISCTHCHWARRLW